MRNKKEYRRVMVTRQGYAVVPANSDEEALEAVKSLSASDFDWETVDEGLLENAEVVDVCGPCGESIPATVEYSLKEEELK